MNEQIVQSVISDLGNTIAQLHVDLAMERATVKELVKELEEAKKTIERFSAPTEAIEPSEEI